MAGVWFRAFKAAGGGLISRFLAVYPREGYVAYQTTDHIPYNTKHTSILHLVAALVSSRGVS